MIFFFLKGGFLCSTYSFSVQAQFVLLQSCPDRRSACNAHLRCQQLCVQTVDKRWQTCSVRRQAQPPRRQQNIVHQHPGPHRLGRVHLQRQQRFKLWFWFSQMQPPSLQLVLAFYRCGYTVDSVVRTLSSSSSPSRWTRPPTVVQRSAKGKFEESIRLICSADLLPQATFSWTFKSTMTHNNVYYIDEQEEEDRQKHRHWPGSLRTPQAT